MSGLILGVLVVVILFVCCAVGFLGGRLIAPEDPNLRDWRDIALCILGVAWLWLWLAGGLTVLRYLAGLVG